MQYENQGYWKRIRDMDYAEVDLSKKDHKSLFVSSVFLVIGLIHCMAGALTFVWPDWIAANMAFLFPLSFDPHPIMGHLHGSSGIYGLVMGGCIILASTDLKKDFFFIHILTALFVIMGLHKVFMINRIHAGLDMAILSEEWPHFLVPILFVVSWFAIKPPKNKNPAPIKKVKKKTAIERKRVIGAFWSKLVILIFRPISKMPRMQKWLWKRWYSWISSDKKRTAEFSFMNFGHRELTESNERLRQNAFNQLKRQPMGVEQQNMARLYYFACQAFGAGLEDAEILEVGSGRGGGARLIVENYPILNYIGVDLSPKAIAFSTAANEGVKRLHFEPGDAEALPLVDKSRNVVINIESSHCYPNFPEFLDEVNRVLIDGGHFIFADFRPTEDMEKVRAEMETAGFAIVDARDITENIIAALDHDSSARSEFVSRFFPRWIKNLMLTFAGVKGSVIYESFCAGKHEYWFFVLRKTQAQIAEVSVELE